MDSDEQYKGYIALNIVMSMVILISILWLFCGCSQLVNAEMEKVAIEVIDDIPELIHEEVPVPEVIHEPAHQPQVPDQQ